MQLGIGASSTVFTAQSCDTKYIISNKYVTILKATCHNVLVVKKVIASTIVVPGSNVNFFL